MQLDCEARAGWVHTPRGEGPAYPAGQGPAYPALVAMLAGIAWESADAMALSWLDGRGFIDVNGAFQAYFGIPRAELAGRPGWGFAHLVTVEDRDFVAGAVARGIPLNRLPVRLAAANGAPRAGYLWARTHLLPGGPVGVFLVKDATEAARAGRLLALQRAAAELLGGAPASEFETAAHLMAEFGERLGWDVGAYWRPEPGGRLRCRAMWESPHVSALEFAPVTLSLAVAYGQDLPGLVLAERAPVSLEIAQCQHLARGTAAFRDGLRTGFGFPVLSGGQPVAVFEMFSRRHEPVDDALRQTAGTLGQLFTLYLRSRYHPR